MKNFIKILSLLAISLLALSLFMCQPPVNKVTNVSDAIIDVPSSLSGAVTISKDMMIPYSKAGLTVSQKVSATISIYYALVREQIKVAAFDAKYVKALIQELEKVTINGKTLFENTTEVTHTATNGDKLKFAPTANANEYVFEIWMQQADNSYAKFFEMTFTYIKGDKVVVRGTAIANLNNNPRITAATNGKNPDWAKLEFDTNKDNTGKGWMKIYVNGFQFNSDLDTGTTDGYQECIIELTKETDGSITAKGNTQVPGSRWFVWNGMNYDNTVNTSSTPEKRYYVFTGKSNTNNLSTVNLAIASGNYTNDDTVFTDFSISAVLRQLFTDKLNNNYDFGNSVTGHGLINVLNLANTGTQYILDTTTYANTSTAVYDAIKNADITINTDTTDDDSVQNADLRYFRRIFEIGNPSYFEEAKYTAYNSTYVDGDQAPTGYYTSSDVATITPVTRADIATLQADGINFTNTTNITTPGF